MAIGLGAAGLIAGAGLLGSGINMVGSALSSRKAYKRQLALMREQMAWQERMANTAHQREVTDLKAAGLNPILSATGGSGADTGSTGAPQVNAEDFSQIDANAMISNALQAKRMKHENNLMDEQAKTEESKRENFNANTDLQKAEKLYKMAELKYLPQRVKAELKEIASRITLNAATTSAKQAEKNLIKEQGRTEKTKQIVNNAEAKYTNERSRGYSESNTTTVSGGSHEGPIGRNSSVTKSKSRTW